MSQGIIDALNVLEEQKGISKDVLIEAIETALISAYKKNYGQSQNVEVNFNESTGEFDIIQSKEVVEEVTDDSLEVSLADMRQVNPAYEVGDIVRSTIKAKEFGRIAAQTAKQVITQRMREEERNQVYEEYIAYEDDLLQGIVERKDNRYIYLNIGRIEAVLSTRDQMPNEDYYPQERINVYVSSVENTTKGPQVFVSRTHPNLVKRLFEQEVPEVYDGTVEIKGIAREAGDRSKVAVYSDDDSIDPVGTTVGPRGMRVQAIVNELNGENMDIVVWDKDPIVFITNALKPADVIDVHFVPNEENSVIAVVPDYQLSLAIGKRGQNVRLAARLTKYKIDIKPESEMEDFSFEDVSDENVDTAVDEVLDDTLSPQAEVDEETLHADVESLAEADSNPNQDTAEDDVRDINYEEGELSPEQAEDMAELSRERQDEDEQFDDDIE